MAGQFKARVGDVFEDWTLLEYVGGGYWLCRCKCGVEKKVLGSHLYGGKSTRCKSCYLESNKTDAYTNRSTYQSWTHMRNRCLNPTDDRYHQYGGRGITICKRWGVFELFLKDMGPRPEGTSLDRIDVDGDYEPANCRWATPKEQMRNRQEHKNKVCVNELAEVLGIPAGTLRARLRRGWGYERATSTPVKK